MNSLPLGEGRGGASFIQYRGDTIAVAATAPLRKQITVRKARLEDFPAMFKTVGTVRPVAGKLAEISAPFAGRIIKSFVRLGQQVNAGTPLFALGAPELYETAKIYFAARSANELAQKNYLRQTELAANGVAAQRALEQAKSEASIAHEELELAKAILRLYDVDILSLEAGYPLAVRSPIAGEVVKSDITIGSYVKEDSAPLAVVADLSQVWIAALVKENCFGAIRHGDRVEVYTGAHPGKAIRGAIDYIGAMMDEGTRALEVIVACDNASRELKPGMFCEVHFLSAPVRAIVLPSTAVMQEQDSDYVLVEAAAGMYVRRKVETESIDMNRVRIISGISEGENVVTEGGIFLNR
jgi:cobalt-zinc-cadmium efflux system membrane fusion protein